MSVYNLGARRGAVRPSPLFLTVLAVTLLGGVLAWTSADRPGQRLGDFGVFLLVLGGWVTSVCFHEFAHAYLAYRAGDRSVEARGYLTLNPFKYTHPFLSIFLPLLAIVLGGFALPGGAVYLQPHAFRSKVSRAMVAAAGPLTNVVFAIALTQLAQGHETSSHARFWYGLAFLGVLQVTAAILNLLPVPGLDGYAIIEPYLDRETQVIGEKVKPWGLLAVIVLVWYITPLKNAFFDLVDWVYRLIGGNDALHYFGYLFFKFWTKNPA